MLSARPCRSVDAAAAQLIGHEAGGAVEFAGYEIDEADLGLDARYAVLAARNDELLASVRSAGALTRCLTPPARDRRLGPRAAARPAAGGEANRTSTKRGADDVRARRSPWPSPTRPSTRLAGSRGRGRQPRRVDRVEPGGVREAPDADRRAPGFRASPARTTGDVARKALSAAAGAEAGAVVGYAAKRVLGQYQVSLRSDPGESPACCWWAPTSRRRPRSSGSTRSRSFCGCSSTSRPTRSSSARCPGCAGTSRAWSPNCSSRRRAGWTWEPSSAGRKSSSLQTPGPACAGSSTES